MSQRFFTADWHLGSNNIIQTYNRPFSSVERMNASLISICNNIAPEKTDIVYHIGDFASYKSDRGEIGLKINPNLMLKLLKSTFINIEGNHDSHNNVRSAAKSLRISLGPFTDVSLGHYPSYRKEAEGTFLPGDIHLCGHVHDKWKYFIDKENQVLNINVGVDKWGFKPVSEDKLVDYIKKIMKNN